jgi:hypothetical protein
VIVVKIQLTMDVATAASRAVRMRALVGDASPVWGTCIPVAVGLAEGAGHRTEPVFGDLQGTGVSTGRPSGGATQNIQQATFRLDNQTDTAIRTYAVKNAVVTDNPGVRSWSPPV